MAAFGRRWQDRISAAQVAILRLCAIADAVPEWPDVLRAVSQCLGGTTATLYTLEGDVLRGVAAYPATTNQPEVPALLQRLSVGLSGASISPAEAEGHFAQASLEATSDVSQIIPLPLLDGVSFCGWLWIALPPGSAPANIGWFEMESLSRLLGQCVGRIAERDRHRVEKLRLSALLANIGAAILVEDSDRRIVLVNEDFCQLFGIPAPPDALVGVDCSQAAEQVKHLFADPDAFVEGVEELLERREPVRRSEWSFADGRVFERDYVPVFNEGAYLGHLWKYRDVTARVMEAQATDQLRQLYSQILESMPAQLAVFDLEGRYVYVSPSAVRDPVTRAWLIGRTDDEFAVRRGLDPAIGARRRTMLRRVAENNSDEVFEESFRDREGTMRTFVRSVSPVLNSAGEITQVLGYGLDITERRQAEQSVRESEARLRTVLESAIDAVVTFDANGHLIEFSPSAERIFEVAWTGGPTPEPIASLYGAIAPILPGDDDGKRQPFMRRLRMTLHRASGQSFPAEVGITLAVMPDGQRICSMFVQDATWRQLAEGELVSAMKRAEAAVRAQEEFLAHMSHELRTPLNAVIGMVHLLERQHPQPGQTQYLRAIYTSATTLLRTISDILDFSKISAGGVERDDSAFLLEPTVRELLQPLRLQVIAKSLQYRLEVADDVPRAVRGDQLRLGQILLNLLANALRFTTNGEVGLLVSVESRTPESTMMRFEVYDTGIGIAADALEVIFDPFRQADERIARAYGGTGLGLSIAKRLIELAGGSISVESTLGSGTRFTALIPFREAEMADVAAGAPIVYGELSDGEMGDLTGLRVLLAEDNELNRVVARELLRSAGASVTEVHDGLQVMEALKSGPFDVILMDLQMPGMDGYSATRAIRQLPTPEDREIPIVALTASALPEERRRAIAEGIQGFVTKPFSPAQLVGTINSVRRHGTLAVSSEVAPLPHTMVATEAAVPASVVAASTVIDLAVLATSTLGQLALRRQVLELVLTHTPPLQQQMAEAANAGECEALRVMAHRLCGSASTIGAHAWEASLRQVERRAEQARPVADLTDAVEAATRAGNQVLEQAGEILASTV
jgi:PAS domain S-box-containing protein